jgi:hypothetical protein
VAATYRRPAVNLGDDGIAAMDLGTNSFHLLVADVHPDGHISPS